MALPEETEIMSEIGLGNHYNWYNGSPSCKLYRQSAAEQLEERLLAHGCNPDPELLQLAATVADIELSPLSGSNVHGAHPDLAVHQRHHPSPSAYTRRSQRRDVQPAALTDRRPHYLEERR